MVIKMEPKLYKFLRPLLYIFIKLYRPTIIGKENIPNGRCVLAGNHTSYYDPLLIGMSTKRCVHFFAKAELNKGFKKIIFNNIGIIPVNRKIKDKNAVNMGIQTLNEDKLVAIFPEGTINRTDDIIMPFKFGAVKIASETDAPIVPFAIVGKYKFMKKNVKIIFGKSYKINSDLEIENKKLENKVKKLIGGNYEFYNRQTSKHTK